MELTAETFRPLADTDFAHREEPVVLVLAEVIDHPGAPGAPRTDPFSLQFLGPADKPLGQAIHPLTHPELGDVEIFLVPIAREGDQLRYEAVFN